MKYFKQLFDINEAINEAIRRLEYLINYYSVLELPISDLSTLLEDVKISLPKAFDNLFTAMVEDDKTVKKNYNFKPLDAVWSKGPK